MPGGTYFLDTTAFADAIFGRPEKRRAVKACLEGKTLGSSTYVREQFRATFLHASIMAFNELLVTGDPLEVLSLTDEWQFFTTGQGQKARMVVIHLLRADGVDADDKLDTLERMITRDIMREFGRLAQVITNETECCLCHGQPEKDAQGFFELKRKCTLSDPRPCKIEAFWNVRTLQLSAIAKLDHPEGAAKAAKEVVEENQLPRGKRCYVALSDAVIVAEAPEGSTLVTSNVKDFNPLAAAIGGRTVIDHSPTEAEPT
jgi:hypothetical protein